MAKMRPQEIAGNFGSQYWVDAAKRGINVSQLLEQLDPTSGYPENERDLDAFERMTREMGLITQPIREAGIRASAYEDVVKNDQGKAWFAEFCSRTWREAAGWIPARPATRAVMSSSDYTIGGPLQPWSDDLTLIESRLQVAIPLSSIISGVREIDGDGYRSIFLTDGLTSDNYRMKRVGEGTEIPATSLVTGERSIRIHKFGRAIRYTYEQVRRQRIDRIQYLVARLALVSEADKVDSALATIVSGDGNANTAATVYAMTSLDSAAAAGTLTLKAFRLFKNRFFPYIPRIVLGQEEGITQLEVLPLSTGNSIPYIMANNSPFGGLTPINPTAWQLGYGVVASAPALKLVMFDPAWAVEQVSEIGSTISELERYINNQTWMLTMTETNGFATIDPAAARILNING